MLRSYAIVGALLAAFLLVGDGLAAAQSKPRIGVEKRLPINLEAASSQFDGRNNELSFRKVLITQGIMSVRADHGKVARLDFENSRWLFEGDVVIDNQGARVRCDSAELRFVGHELRSALLRGDPVRFEQSRPSGEPAEGKAQVMEYDVSAATLRLSGDAWVSDGANEVTGERISYDLAREYVTAESNGNGEIRMKIKPPQDREGDPTP